MADGLCARARVRTTRAKGRRGAESGTNMQGTVAAERVPAAGGPRRRRPPTSRNPPLPCRRSGKRHSSDLRQRNRGATRWARPGKPSRDPFPKGAQVGEGSRRSYATGGRATTGGKAETKAECLAAVRDEDRWASTIHFIPGSVLVTKDAASGDHHARLAGLCCSSSSRSSGRSRTQPAHGGSAEDAFRTSSSRPCRATASPASRPATGWDPDPHRAEPGGADEAPSDTPAYVAQGRRLGAPPISSRGWRARRRQGIARYPPQLAGDGTARGDRGARRAAGAVPAGLSEQETERAVFESLMTYAQKRGAPALQRDDDDPARGRRPSGMA